MVCIYCGHQTQVGNSRHQQRSNSVWRRRKCEKCKAIFTTVERVDLLKSLALNINGTLQPFSRDVLFIDVYHSLKHRKTALADATALTDTIIGRVLPKVSDGIVEATDLIKTCAETLKRFDKTAAVYFAAYHPLT